MRDPYLYQDVDVLENKLGIKDENELNDIERDITASQLMQIDSVKGNFDYEHYKSIHKFVFGDIFDWAGKERSVEIHKGEDVLGGMSVRYTYPTEIAKNAKKHFATLNKTNWADMPIETRAEQYAKTISALWQTHPFREGNTRTTITFACQFADAHGFPMDRQIFAEHAKYTRNALVMASIGEYSEYEHLTKIFKDSMTRGVEKQKTITAGIDNKNSTRYNTVIDMTVPENDNGVNDNSYEI